MDSIGIFPKIFLFLNTEKAGAMKLQDFKILSEKDRYEVLWRDGVLIDGCIDGNMRKLLYAVHNFYVELWCHTKTNKQVWMLSFKQGVLLEKYLEKYSLNI